MSVGKTMPRIVSSYLLLFAHWNGTKVVQMASKATVLIRLETPAPEVLDINPWSVKNSNNPSMSTYPSTGKIAPNTKPNNLESFSIDSDFF